MKKRRWDKVIILGVCLMALLLAGGRVSAQGVDGEVDEEMGGKGTDISAGVLVDYMGKLRFLVKEEKNKKPIEGAFVELYVKGLDKYVLFGETDSSGLFEMDATYPGMDGNNNTNPSDENKNGRISTQRKAVFEDNHLSWRVYKENYLPYPKEGDLILTTLDLPCEVDVYIKEVAETEPVTEPPVTETDPIETETPPNTNKQPETQWKPPVTNVNNGSAKPGSIPKTGVESAVVYWGIGLLLCVLGVLLILVYLGKVKKNEK